MASRTTPTATATLASTRVRPIGCSIATVAAVFAIRAMTEADANAVAGWRYPGEYAFYDWTRDPDDLAELLDPAGWGRRYSACGRT